MLEEVQEERILVKPHLPHQNRNQYSSLVVFSLGRGPIRGGKIDIDPQPTIFVRSCCPFTGRGGRGGPIRGGRGRGRGN